MRYLADVPSDLLMVECGACRRRGVYRLARLVARYGRAHELKAFRAAMRTRCGNAPCVAELRVPLIIGLDRNVFPGNRFALDVWNGAATVDWHVGEMQNFEIASAAFDKAVSLWPDSVITLKVGAHAYRTHSPRDEVAEAAQARVHRWVFGRG